jgi:hypothetical protein
MKTESKGEPEMDQGAATPGGGAGHPLVAPPCGVTTWSTSWHCPFAYLFPLSRKPLIACKYNPLGTPRGRYDEHSSKSSLNCETKVYRTSRRKPNFRRWCLLASWHSRQWRQKTCWCVFHPAAMWNLRTTQPRTLLPTYDEVVNLTSLQ